MDSVKEELETCGLDTNRLQVLIVFSVTVFIAVSSIPDAAKGSYVELGESQASPTNSDPRTG